MNTMKRYHRNLPHILPEGAVFFLTFRLHGSIPYIKLQQLREYYELRKGQNKYEESNLSAIRLQYEIDNESLMEQILEGPLYLALEPCLSIVKDLIHKYDSFHYDLICYCIMPNHVHLIIDTSVQELIKNKGIPLSKSMQLIKGASAYYCNQALKRSGSFWMPESYDHYIRTDMELDRIHCYILENPVKANLVARWKDWNGTYSKFPPD